MKNYVYSDLAIESPIQPSAKELSEKIISGAKVTTLKIDSKESAEKYGRERGRYVTVSFEKVWLLGDEELERVAGVIARELTEIIKGSVKKNLEGDFTVLVVGLGNSDITPDAIGPLTLSELTVTRHLKDIAPEFYSETGLCSVSAFAPGVLAQTGIETLELIRGAVENVRPDAVIAVDALAARSCARLGTTVQISDTGISPGSGIGNRRKAINKSNLGVPVIALGAPTVVDSATLVYDALEKAGITEISDELDKVLKNGRGFFVCPKECDVITSNVSLLLARSLDNAFAML